MNTNQGVKIDERTLAVAHAANTWGYNFISIALLVDIMCRAVVRKEAAWDLFAVMGVSGAISMAYMARHKVLGQVYDWSWKGAVMMLVAGIVGFAVAAALSWRAFLH